MPNTSPLSLNEYIGIEQTKELVGLISTIRIGVFVSSIITAGVLSRHFRIDHILYWLLWVFVTLVVGWWVSRSFTSADIDKANYQKYLHLSPAWSFLTGLSWGCLAFLFYDPEVPVYSIFLSCVLAGYISVAVGSGVIHLPTFLTFSISAISLFFLRFINSDNILFQGLAVGSVLYLTLIVVLTRVMHRNFIRSKAVEFENQSLLRQVTEEKNRAQTAVIEKNNFLAATSHDLRQPLHAMNLYIDALRPRLTDPMDSDILEKVSLSSSSLNDLLHKLLDISRLDANVIEHRPQHLVFADLANRIKEEFLPQASRSNLDLITEVDEQQFVYADPVLLERVIRNLMSNAIKYTQQGHVSLSSTLVDSKIQISICDSGIGVPHNKISSIFSEFTQIGNPERDRNKGLGLGLSIVKRLCDLQGIELLFKSQPNQGTQVRLQVKQGDAGLLPIDNPSMKGGFERLTILCIDDEETIRDGMELIIQSWKCRPLIVSDGASALQSVRQLDVAVDVIISDLRLRNEESGIEVIRAIREELNIDIPAIVVTGDTAVDRIRLVKDSGVAVMHKPLKPSDLREQIERLLITSNQT